MAANIKIECGCFCVIFTGSYLTTKVQSIPTTDGSCFQFYRLVALWQVCLKQLLRISLQICEFHVDFCYLSNCLFNRDCIFYAYVHFFWSTIPIVCTWFSCRVIHQLNGEQRSSRCSKEALSGSHHNAINTQWVQQPSMRTNNQFLKLKPQ